MREHPRLTQRDSLRTDPWVPGTGKKMPSGKSSWDKGATQGRPKTIQEVEIPTSLMGLNRAREDIQGSSGGLFSFLSRNQRHAVS